MVTWIWQRPTWPSFYWDDAIILPLLRLLHVQKGVLLGKTGHFDHALTTETTLNTLLQNIIASNAIENEIVNPASLRSSLAKRLGLGVIKHHSVTRRSEGLAQMMLDAINNLNQPLTLERLCQWHAWLFPEEGQGWYMIKKGELRGEEPMQVVSGRIDKPKVHFEAPPRYLLESELQHFITWFNHSREDAKLDPFLRAALCHFWFVTLHPFDDGNGRITRALTDLVLAEDDKRSIRLYAMSATILAKRQDYYTILEKSQKNSLDITAWIVWFLETLQSSMYDALSKIERTLFKTQFWQKYHLRALLPEQIKILNRLLDGGEKGFEGGISASQYQKVAKVSKATATRHLTHLLEIGCLEKLPGGGRNTKYQIAHNSPVED